MEDAKSRVIYWHENGHDAFKRCQKLSAGPGRAYPFYPSITDWIRRLHKGEDLTRRPSSSGRLLDEQVNILIAAAFKEAPFHSVRSLASVIKYPGRTV
jgi:hypothetical protein